MEKILKHLFILVIFCSLLGCSVQGTYHLQKSFSPYYQNDSMKIVFDKGNKGYIMISDTSICQFSYFPSYRGGVGIIYNAADSLKLYPVGIRVRDNFIISDSLRYSLYFKKTHNK